MAQKGYGQFCPVAKTSEILTERWTPLVVRELLMGSTRFNDLRRGVPLMSPTLLSERLKQLERAGIVARRVVGDHPEYHLTDAGQELRPIIEMMGVWGQRWARDSMRREDLDVNLLMWDIRRGTRPDPLLPGRAVVRFEFSGAPRGRKHWWLVMENESADLCLTDPGHEVDLRVITDVRTLTAVWMGDVAIGAALRAGDIALEGSAELRRRFPGWLGLSTFGDVERPAAS